jgi:hypothetical protein
MRMQTMALAGRLDSRCGSNAAQPMRRTPGAIAAVALAFLLCGCSVHLTDRTPTSFGLTDVTPGVGNERRSRTFELEVRRDPLVFAGSIRATAAVDGVDHAMARGAGDVWSVQINEWDPQRPARLPPEYQVFYTVRYQYLPLPIPIPFAGVERLPDTGTKRVDVTPDVFAERDDPLHFSSATARKEVRVYNLGHTPLAITTAEIRPAGGACFGNGSGQAFAIEDPPVGSRTPTLQPGESITYRLQFTGFTLACGTVAVETDNPSFPLLQFALTGRIFP